MYAAVLAVAAVLNILFFLILNRPAQAEYFSLQESIESLRAQSKRSQLALGNLETRNSQISRFDQDRKTLLTKHFLPRQTGYSRILIELDAIVRRTGVSKTRVTLPIENTEYGLSTLMITLPVEGSYSNIVSFIRELERSDVFLLINGIDVTASESERGDLTAATNISLALTMQTYFYQ
jgi:Tfp pilus assembly protein PilO